MRKGSKMFWGSIMVLSGSLLAFVADAAQSVPIASGMDLTKLLCNVIDWMIWIVGAIAIIMAVIAAFHYATAGDDTEKTTKARKTLTYAAIGIAVSLIAYGVPQLVSNVIGGGSVFSCGAGSAPSSSGSLPSSYSNLSGNSPGQTSGGSASGQPFQ